MIIGQICHIFLQGAEASIVKAKEAAEEIRLEVEGALKAAVQTMDVTLSSDITYLLQPVTFKPKSLFTYHDYQACLNAIAKASGPKGTVNMFGAYSEPCLVTVSTALAKWEVNNLHLLSCSESLTKLVQLIFPSSKRNVEKLHNRTEELTRQISEHDRLMQSYDKKCRDLCEQWGISIDVINSGQGNGDSGDAIGSCQNSIVADSLRQQLGTYASDSYRNSIFESKVQDYSLVLYVAHIFPY